MIYICKAVEKMNLTCGFHIWCMRLIVDVLVKGKKKKLNQSSQKGLICVGRGVHGAVQFWVIFSIVLYSAV